MKLTASLSIALLIALVAPTVRADDANEEDVAKKLAKIAEVSTAQITTIGRKSGKPHTVPIWFAVEGPRIYIWTMDMKRDWPRNIAKNPKIELEIEKTQLKGTAIVVGDPARVAHVTELRNAKYLAARVGGWVGLTANGTYEVQIESIE